MDIGRVDGTIMYAAPGGDLILMDFFWVECFDFGASCSRLINRATLIKTEEFEERVHKSSNHRESPSYHNGPSKASE